MKSSKKWHPHVSCSLGREGLMAEVMMMLMISANKYFVCSWMRTRGKLGIRRTLAQTNFLGCPVAGRCKSVFIILLVSPFFGYLSALKDVCVCACVHMCKRCTLFHFRFVRFCCFWRLENELSGLNGGISASPRSPHSRPCKWVRPVRNKMRHNAAAAPNKTK